MITPEQIKTLRGATGVSVMLCRKALEEAGGDFEKAKEILRKKRAGASAEKASRTFGAGTVAAYLHQEGVVGALVVLSCETDFVSQNEEFKALAHDLAMQVAATNPRFLRREDISEAEQERVRTTLRKEVAGEPKGRQEEILEEKVTANFADKILLEQPFIKDPSVTVRSLIEGAVQKFGERSEVTRFVRFGIGDRA